MPWNNQNGGGGWKGGGGGPWGQGPQGGGPSNQQPPDLEELLKRSQDKFKQAMPGGGGGVFWLIAIVLVLFVWGFNSVHTIDADEEGVVLRFGKYDRTLPAGLRVVLWPVETIEKVKYTAQNQETFGLGNREAFGGSSSGNSDSLMLAGDLNLVDIKFTVLWKIKDSQNFLFNVKDPQGLIKGVSQSAMREVVGRTTAEKVRTTQREATQDEVKKLIQAALDTYNAGISIQKVNLEDADPPRQVAKAFEEVQGAAQEQNRLIREAERYRNEKLGTARGQASQTIEAAKGYKARIVAEAEGEAQRFISVYNEYVKAKDVTRKRLFFETMEQVLSKSNKVIIEKGGSGVVPYLPLPEVGKRSSANRGGQ